MYKEIVSVLKFLFLFLLSFYAIRKNKVLTNISEFTVFNFIWLSFDDTVKPV